MVNLEVLKQQINRKKNLNKNLELVGNIGSGVGLALIAGLAFIPQFTFLPFLITFIAVEAAEQFAKKKVTERVDNSDVMNGIISKMTLDTLENAVASRYILQKLSMINTKSEFSQNLRHNNDGDLKDTINSFARKFGRKFKTEVEIPFSDFTVKEYLFYAKKNKLGTSKLLLELNDFQIDLKEFKEDNELSDKELPSKTTEDIAVEESMRNVMSPNFIELSRKIEFLNKEKLTSEQTAILNDVKTDVETIQRIYQKLNSTSGKTLDEGKEKVEEIVNNCLEITNNLTQEQGEDVLKEIRVLDNHVNKKVMKMKA